MVLLNVIKLVAFLIVFNKNSSSFDLICGMSACIVDFTVHIVTFLVQHSLFMFPLCHECVAVLFYSSFFYKHCVVLRCVSLLSQNESPPYKCSRALKMRMSTIENALGIHASCPQGPTMLLLVLTGEIECDCNAS